MRRVPPAAAKQGRAGGRPAPDPVAAVLAFNAGRDPERLARKYAALRDNPFSFLRGTCHLYYAGWPSTSLLDQAPAAWLCGDLHFENFGSYKGDNRLVYFDINDFDEAVLAPCSWEIARFLSSLLVGAGQIGISRPEALSLGRSFIDRYRAALQQGKARWIERATASGMVRELLLQLKRRPLAKFVASRTISSKKGRQRLRCDGEKALPVSDADRQRIIDFLAGFAADSADPAFYRVIDIARRIAGTGSLGLERYIILVEGHGLPEGHHLLDLKYAPASALQPHVAQAQPAWRSEAERVVWVQRAAQAISPAFLHAVTIDQRSYILRELMPSQDRLRLEQWEGRFRRLEQVVHSMADNVAWAQLRASGRQGAACADALIDFGRRDDWVVPLLAVAEDAAVRNQQHWQAFRRAYDDGGLVAD